MTEYIPLYDDNILIFGQEPGGGGSTTTSTTTPGSGSTSAATTTTAATTATTSAATTTTTAACVPEGDSCAGQGKECCDGFECPTTNPKKCKPKV